MIIKTLLVIIKTKLIKFKVYVAEKVTGRVALVFKYRDQGNYFAVEMNPNES